MEGRNLDEIVSDGYDELEGASLAAARQQEAAAYWRSRERVGLVLADGQRAHFFSKEDETLSSGSLNSATDPRGHPSTHPAHNPARRELSRPLENGDDPRSDLPHSDSSLSITTMGDETDQDDEPYHEDPDVILIGAPDKYIDHAGREQPSPGCIDDSGVRTKRVPKYVPMNVHLGKAGGLNFGMQAVLMKLYEAGLEPPSETRPMFFAITDARHAGDERWWLHILPPFFMTNPHDETDAAVAFDKSIAFVQVAHSYLGIEANTDYLDMRNDFMFTGMAVVRDQAYGMTSCGTGGIWSITRHNQLDSYFFGRTMIEDTASSTEMFLQGRKSVYVTPFANKAAEHQLMCAVPKVSANFLEALERWDKGAVQCFCAQAATFTKGWFWLAALVYLFFGALFLVPAFWPLGLHLVLHHSVDDIKRIILHPMETWDPERLFTPEFESILAVIIPAVIWILLLLIMWVMMTCTPVRFNAILRGCVLLFNHACSSLHTPLGHAPPSIPPLAMLLPP